MNKTFETSDGKIEITDEQYEIVMGECSEERTRLLKELREKVKCHKKTENWGIKSFKFLKTISRSY